MFSCCLPEETKNQRFASRAIDRQLQKDKYHFRRTIKILLLGSGESGKSTFLKQMRIIHGGDFVDEELKQYRLVIYSNIVNGMKVLIDARDKLGIPWGDEASARPARFIFGYDNNVKLDEFMFAQFLPAITALWADSGIRMAFDRRREFQLVSEFIKIGASAGPKRGKITSARSLELDRPKFHTLRRWNGRKRC